MNELDQLPPDDTENCCLTCNARGFNCEGVFREEGHRCCAGCRHKYSTMRPVDYWRQRAQSGELERADWATIEEWRSRNSHEFQLTAVDAAGNPWRCSIINWGPKSERRGEFEGERAAVIKRAAGWCRADERRDHDERVEANLELLRERAESEELVAVDTGLGFSEMEIIHRPAEDE
jgi:hypothetical protein